jgi:Ras-related protein Rab-8A
MVKIIIVGDTGVGKTNIISRFCCKEGEEGEFRDYHVATIGVDFSTKVIAVGNRRLKMQIWDTAGQERFKTITETYYKGAAGIILVYAVDSEDAFLNIGISLSHSENWIEQVNLRSS